MFQGVSERELFRLKTDVGGLRAMIGQMKRNEWPTPSNERDAVEIYNILVHNKGNTPQINRALAGMKEMLTALHEKKMPLPAHFEAASFVVSAISEVARAQAPSNLPTFVHSPLCNCPACTRANY